MDNDQSDEDYGPRENSDEEYQNQACAFELQEMVSEQKLKMFPHNAIGVITIDYKSNIKGIPNGTGFLIAPNLVVTVGHVIFDATERVFYKNIAFCPAALGVLVNKMKVVEYRVLKQYQNVNLDGTNLRSEVEYDYALLKLQKPIHLDKYFTLSYKFNNDSQKLSIYGYPKGCKQNGSFASRQTGFSGQCQISIMKVSTKFKEIMHTLPTRRGHSGSPILIWNSEVIGLHKAEVRNRSNLYFRNSAVLVNEKMIQNFKKWSKEMSPDVQCPFQTSSYIKNLSSVHFKILKEQSYLKILRSIQFQPLKQLYFQNLTKQLTEIISKKNCQQPPKCCIGKITSKYPCTQGKIGTSFLISNNLLLTSFTDIYPQIQYNGWINIEECDVKFQPSFGSAIFRASALRYNKQSINITKEKKNTKLLLEDIANNFCLIKLQQKIELPFYLQLLTNFRNQNQKSKLYGFQKSQDEWKMTVSQGSNLDIFIDKKLISHQTPTSQGMDGAPFIVQGNKVIGFHRSMLKNRKQKIGRLVTNDLIAKLFEWNEELKGSQFKAWYCQNGKAVEVKNAKDIDRQHLKWKQSIRKQKFS